MTALDRLALDYRAALLRALPRRGEAALANGYELGRQCVAAGIGLLDLVRIHHQAVQVVLEDTPPDEFLAVAAAGGEFLLEVLASYDMTQRAAIRRE